MMDLKAKVVIPVSKAKTKLITEGATATTRKIGVTASWLLMVCIAGLVNPIRSFDTAHAQTGPFYEGKTVRVIIGPGGGYDYWGRLLARYMPKYIPGNPSFIVQNMPGAGSVIATNYVHNVAKPDGLTVGMPTQQIYMGEFVGNDEVKFQMRKFLWIGSPDRNPTILYIRADTPYKTIDDVIKSKVPPKCGGTGWESSSLIVALEDALGAKFELVLGYQEASQVDLAVVRGEVVCRDLGLTAHFSREPFLSWHAKGFEASASDRQKTGSSSIRCADHL